MIMLPAVVGVFTIIKYGVSLSCDWEYGSWQVCLELQDLQCPGTAGSTVSYSLCPLLEVLIQQSRHNKETGLQPCQNELAPFAIFLFLLSTALRCCCFLCLLQVFTIEPMVNVGTWKDMTWPDGWTAVTVDGKRSAQFEHQLLVTKKGAEVLTARLPTSWPLWWEGTEES